MHLYTCTTAPASYGKSVCLVANLLRKLAGVDIALWDTTGKPMSPKWLETGSKVCGGTTTLNANGSITVEHKGGPDANALLLPSDSM